MDAKRTVQRISKTKSWHFEKVNKTDKLAKRKREMTQINKIKVEKGDITTDTNNTQRIIREYFENLKNWKI
jgi:hypothetical protein